MGPKNTNTPNADHESFADAALPTRAAAAQPAASTPSAASRHTSPVTHPPNGWMVDSESSQARGIHDYEILLWTARR